jgi:hypothetical protein
MKANVFFSFCFLFYMLSFWGCSGDTPEKEEEEIIRYEQAPGIVSIIYEPCTDRQTVKILENESAIVRRNNVFQTEGEDISIRIDAESIDTFAFEIYNRYEGVMPCPLVSRYRVPEKYRIDGLEVKISGEITNCYVGLSAPYARFMPQNIFELTSIEKKDPLTITLLDQDTVAIQQSIWGKWICAYGKGGLANIVHHHYDGYTFEFTADKQYIINNGKGKTEANTYYWQKYALYTGSSDSVYVMFPNRLLFEEIKNDTLIYSDPPMLMTDGITYYLIKAEN